MFVNKLLINFNKKKTGFHYLINRSTVEGNVRTIKNA